MAMDPRIILAGRDVEIPDPNIVRNLKANARVNEAQAGALERTAADDQAMRSAVNGSLTNAEAMAKMNPLQRQKFAQSVAVMGKAQADMQKAQRDAETAALTQQTEQMKIQATRAAGRANFLNPLLSEKDPNAAMTRFKTDLPRMQQLGLVSDEELAQYSAMGYDQLKPQWQSGVDEATSLEDRTKVAAAELKARLDQEKADREAALQGPSLTEAQAKATAAQLQNASRMLLTAPNDAIYQVLKAKLPADIQALAPPTWTPDARAQILQMGQTPAEVVKSEDSRADNARATLTQQMQANRDAETARHNRASEERMAAALAMRGKDDSKNLPEGAMNKLEANKSVSDRLGTLKARFDDKFSGNRITGSVENWLGKLGGEEIGATTPGQTDWWQNYQDYINAVRKELFGAALTPGEQAEFEKATIQPSSAASVVRTNLKRQKEIIDGALNRRADAYSAGSFNKAQVDVFRPAKEDAPADGSISVISPDGKRGSIPAEDWAEAQKAGYKKQ